MDCVEKLQNLCEVAFDETLISMIFSRNGIHLLTLPNLSL